MTASHASMKYSADVSQFAVVAMLLAVGASHACSDAQPSCTTVDTACQPLYVPTFDNVYRNTIASKCGGDSASCHSAAGAHGGLILADRATAYAALTSGSATRVIPGDPGCSGMIVRINADGKTWLMPPRSPLAAAERCALAQWVQNGAIGP
jgi:hypothetical protein